MRSYKRTSIEIYNPNVPNVQFFFLPTLRQMKAGWFMNIVCVIVICVLMETWGRVIFNVKEFPDWAVTPNDTTTDPCLLFTDSTTASSFAWVH